MNQQEQEFTNEDHFEQEYEFTEERYATSDIANALVEVKVSDDGGETWNRRKINLGGEIDESGLNNGDIFQINGEKYKVLDGEFGLTIEPMRKPAREKRSKRK